MVSVASVATKFHVRTLLTICTLGAALAAPRGGAPVVPAVAPLALALALAALALAFLGPRVPLVPVRAGAPAALPPLRRALRLLHRRRRPEIKSKD